MLTTSRFFFFTFLISLITIGSYAQQGPLPVDSASGKIVFEDVVLIDSMSASMLFKNAERWVNTQFPSKTGFSEFNLSTGYAKSTGRFFVYTKGALSKEVHGTIRFDVKVEVKENKYKYTFEHFVFEYYKQNRDLKYAPNGREKPLEETKFAGWETAWQKHKIKTYEQITAHINALKIAMKDKGIAPPPAPVKKKIEW